MANNKKFIAKNGLRAQNLEFTDSQDGSNQILLNMLNTDTLNFEGDAGSLFSISDDLTGTVFSVGDISGLPIIEANGDTHNVTLAQFNGKVMIAGTDSGSTDSDVLNVTGNVRATAFYGDGSNLTGVSSGGLDSNLVLTVSGATTGFREYLGGETFDPDGGGTGTDTATDVAIAIRSGNRIIGTHDGYIRNIIDFEGNAQPLSIGQHSTAIFNHTRIYGGNNGVELYENTTKRLETTDSGLYAHGSLHLDKTGDATVHGVRAYGTTTAQATDKIRLYGDTTTAYTIGFSSGYTFGGLGNDYAINFTNSNTDARGFIWDDTNHTGAQGAMALTTNGKLTVAHSIRVGYGEDDTTTPGATHALDVNGSLAATSKSFVIDHPTKEGMQLRHGSLEGPENGVYVRGRLEGNNTIELPDYWTGLVDSDTITVNLTPIGSSQNLYVDNIGNNRVTVGGESNVNCFYTVYGERKDTEKIVVEY